MTPGARVAAAIEVLDRIGAGAAAEQALTSWARGHRFAGSKDRAAIRDHVFAVLRRRASAAHAGGGGDGRALMIGLWRVDGRDPAEVFTGEGYAPRPLSAAEQAVSPGAPGVEARHDMPGWLVARFEAALGSEAAPTMQALTKRAAVHLRVNRANRIGADRAAVQVALAAEGIETVPHPLALTALEVVSGGRRVAASMAYRDGLVELQDAASQAVAEGIPIGPGVRVLDYCAGGGGKALALAARGADLWAHDVAPGRMADIPARSARAGTPVRCVTTAQAQAAAPFDVVLVDSPCSGSGAWRRSPQAKWDLTPERLAELTRLQAQILRDVMGLVAPAGRLVYATCSLLAEENAQQVARFLAEAPGWSAIEVLHLTPRDGGDGFFAAHLLRSAN